MLQAHDGQKRCPLTIAHPASAGLCSEKDLTDGEARFDLPKADCAQSDSGGFTATRFSSAGAHIRVKHSRWTCFHGAKSNTVFNTTGIEYIPILFLFQRAEFVA